MEVEAGGAPCRNPRAEPTGAHPKGAVVGGHLLWIAPAIETLTPKVLAHELSGSFTCCQCRRSTGQHRAFTDTAADQGACEALWVTQTNPSGWVIGAPPRLDAVFDRW